MTRFVKKGLKYVKLPSSELIDSKTALVYRSQVTEDEDWYKILDWRRDSTSDIGTLVALGDDYKKEFYQK